MFAVLALAILVWGALSKMREQPFTRRPVTHTPVTPSPYVRRSLARLGEHDPDFSLVLFDDFLVLLYTEIKMAQGSGSLARYSPYLSEATRASLGSTPAIRNVLVGVVAIESVNLSSSHVRVTIGFESNYDVGPRSVYVRELWTLVRKRDARSRTPDKARVLGCPSCGAPLDVVVAGVCGHCKSQVTSGDFDWAVEKIAVQGTQERGPMLTSNVVEQGTNTPTIIAEGVAVRLAAITTWESIESRTRTIFTEFQAAWAARDLARMRPYMSNALFAAQTFWVEEYKRQGLRNLTDDAQITRLELCEVVTDAHYDAVTVRLHASSLDYTVTDTTGEVVSGSRSVPRRYTEYWTIIRGRGASSTAKVCPRCGAELDIGMGGHCGYCKTKVTSAVFEWVLSRIEQDEVYRG